MPNSTHWFSPEELWCLADCSSFKQYFTMRKRFESEQCGFCVIDPAINTTLFKNDHWILWENAFKNNRACKVMLVIITKEHWRRLGEITPEAWASFYKVIGYAEKHYDLEGGMLFMRFGNMQLNAGTVPHLHFNLWVPDETGEVRVPIFKKPEDRQASEDRAAGFAKRYEAGEIPG